MWSLWLVLAVSTVIQLHHLFWQSFSIQLINAGGLNNTTSLCTTYITGHHKQTKTNQQDFSVQVTFPETPFRHALPPSNVLIFEHVGFVSEFICHAFSPFLIWKRDLSLFLSPSVRGRCSCCSTQSFLRNRKYTDDARERETTKRSKVWWQFDRLIWTLVAKIA